MKNMHTDVRVLRFKECIVRLAYCHLLCMSALKVNKSNVLFPFMTMKLSSEDSDSGRVYMYCHISFDFSSVFLFVNLSFGVFLYLISIMQKSIQL